MEEKTKLWYFDNFDLLKPLSMKEKMELSNITKMKTIPKNESVYYAGDHSLHVYFLKKGKIKISKHSDGGKELILAILEPGNIFGELAVTGDEHHNETAQAMEESLICSMEVKAFTRFMENNSAFNLSITKLIGLRLKKVQSQLEALCFKNSEERIRDFIKAMAHNHGRQLINGTEVEVKLNLTHKDIAKLTATSRQKVTTVMSNLEKQNVILYDRRRILVKDYQKL